MTTPLIAKLAALSLLSIVWLLVSRRAMRLDTRHPYHLAAYKRDERKARLYFLSVWAGLGAAFFSLLATEALGRVVFETSLIRDVVRGITNGVGLWGVLTIAMIWMQVGQRVSQPNSDGQSLTRLPQDDTN